MTVKLICLMLKMISTKRITSENVNFEHKKEKQKWNEPIGKRLSSYHSKLNKFN